MDILLLILSGVALTFIAYVVCLIAAVRQRFNSARRNQGLIILNIVLLVMVLLLLPLWLYMNVGGYRDLGSPQRDPLSDVWFYSPAVVIAVLVITMVYTLRMVRKQKTLGDSPWFVRAKGPHA